MKVLIINNLYKNVLASIRSMGKSKYNIEIDIACFEQAKIHRLFKSHYLNQVYKITNPVRDFVGFKSDIEELIDKKSYDMILPYGFISTVALSKLKEYFADKEIILPVGDFQTIIKAHDKEACLKAAHKIGLSIPKTYEYESVDQLEDLIESYPIIIKARRFSGIKKGFAIAKDFVQLKEEFTRISSQKGDGEIVDFSRPIVQEFIEGDLYDSCFFFKDGEAKSYVFQQRVMSTAGKIGPGIINETLNNDLKSEAFEYGRKLLKEIDWEGASQVELIYDKKEKKFKLIEVNPKLWGTLELSIRVGVDFPLNMIRYYYYNEDVNIVNYPSIKFCWIWNIILYMLKQKKLDMKEISKLIRNENNEIDKGDFWPEIYKFINLISKSLKK